MHKFNNRDEAEFWKLMVLEAIRSNSICVQTITDLDVYAEAFSERAGTLVAEEKAGRDKLLALFADEVAPKDPSMDLDFTKLPPFGGGKNEN